MKAKIREKPKEESVHGMISLNASWDKTKQSWLEGAPIRCNGEREYRLNENKPIDSERLSVKPFSFFLFWLLLLLLLLFLFNSIGLDIDGCCIQSTDTNLSVQDEEKKKKKRGSARKWRRELVLLLSQENSTHTDGCASSLLFSYTHTHIEPFLLLLLLLPILLRFCVFPAVRGTSARDAVQARFSLALLSPCVSGWHQDHLLLLFYYYFLAESVVTGATARQPLLFCLLSLSVKENIRNRKEKKKGGRAS